MQTSSLTPVTLYSSLSEEAACLLPLLPEGSHIAPQLSQIADNQRSVLVAHDQSSAREASQWVSEQADYRHKQIFLLLPQGESRLNPPCTYHHRPMRLNHLLRFLTSSRALPPLASSITLTEIETNLIEQLHTANEPVSHPILMQKIWGHTAELDTHTLETHLYRLRKKLENTALKIITEDGSYQLTSTTNG